MKTFSITDTGISRRVNQDYVFTSEQPIGNLPNLFLVADGMGGHNAGDYASRYAVETIIDIASHTDQTEVAGILRQAIKAANQNLVERAKEEMALQGMGTTAVAAVVDLNAKRLYVANVGDSRLYIINEGIWQITKDHSLVEEMVRMGELDRDVARIHPDRHIITRAIGVTDSVTVDIFEIELQMKDQILMCSDGLTTMIEDYDIRMIFNSQRDIVEKAEKLVETANDNGGSDNITVIVIEPFSDEVR
jgi:protein phosphatase